INVKSCEMKMDKLKGVQYRRVVSGHYEPCLSPVGNITNELLKFKNPTEEEQRRPQKKPSECSVLLFSGQGSQFVGRGLLRYRNVKDMFGVAQKYTLMFYTNNIIVFLYKHLVVICDLIHLKAIENCVAAAGFIVGEFAALVVIAGHKEVVDGWGVHYSLKLGHSLGPQHPGFTYLTFI
uniref:Uncharacterized protein n=1 Tax=Oncorhynchus kisutch TaxID=8019 RepID=A0A8C7DSR9_ONCKI